MEQTKLIPLLITIMFSIVWLIVEVIAPSKTGLFGVLLIGSWFNWIALSLYRDKDLPMMGFGFESGLNQTGRYLATYGMTGIFVWLVISDLQKLI